MLVKDPKNLIASRRFQAATTTLHIAGFVIRLLIHIHTAALRRRQSSTDQCTATICPGARPPRYAYAGCRAWPLPRGADFPGIQHQLIVDSTSSHSNHGPPPSVVAKRLLPPPAQGPGTVARQESRLEVLVVPSRSDIPSDSTRHTATAAGSNAQDIEVHTDMDHCSATKTLSH